MFSQFKQGKLFFQDTMVKIAFKKLQRSHFPLLHQWMNTPHVMKWWGENHAWTFEDITQKYNTYVLGYKIINNLKAPIHGFIICINNIPIGYIQYYNAYDFPREHGYKLENLPQSMASIDLYIGDINFLSKGYGPLIITQFLKQHVFDKFNTCMVDPDLDNLNAIKAYEKAGFKLVQEIKEANSLLMLLAK